MAYIFDMLELNPKYTLLKEVRELNYFKLGVRGRKYNKSVS